uniref:MAM domain-containing protein n=1 Tax=Syphacia muris TaxID=451379 RepID=A0A0N5ALB4_9BILA
MSDLTNASAQSSGSNPLVTRILQIAFGLFVTTTDFPSNVDSNTYLKIPTYDCSFDELCRWSVSGFGEDRWRLATTDPDTILWLAATGTTLRPTSPYALIELRGKSSEWLMTDSIRCQKGSAVLSFTYWTIGDANLEICLTDDFGRKYNCTGMLETRSMPGKVSLKIPELQRPYHISFCPNTGTGVIALDNIKFDAIPCVPEQMVGNGRPATATPFPQIQQTIATTEDSQEASSTVTSAPSSSLQITAESITRPQPRGLEMLTPTPETQLTTDNSKFTSSKWIQGTNNTSTAEAKHATSSEEQFDILILGNKTSPFHDRRQQRFISDTSQLLCDFSNEFPCRWGPESGRWGIIEKGAIPSLAVSHKMLPVYPAAVVIQGSAMLSSDPIKCQSGSGKVLFRYWSNSRIYLQVCALGYGTKNMQINCVEKSRKKQSFNDRTLAVFDLPNPIDEPFTVREVISDSKFTPLILQLNIVPQWGRLNHNEYLVIDEIAYIGECDLDKLEEKNRVTEETENEKAEVPSNKVETARNKNIEAVTSRTTPQTDTTTTLTILKWTTDTLTVDTESTTVSPSTEAATPVTQASVISVINVVTTTTDYSVNTEVPPEITTVTEQPVTDTILKLTAVQTSSSELAEVASLRPPTAIPLPPEVSISLSTASTVQPTYRPLDRFLTRRPFVEVVQLESTTSATKRPESFTVGFTPSTTLSVENVMYAKDYCALLNCNFEVNACNYLNHGLTKSPWSLRNRGYGFPLSRYNDIRNSPGNGQFVSTLLAPGDFAILESPKFNITRGMNVLLFQYYRPSFYSTIRLCIGGRNSVPYTNPQSFLQCPPILRSTSTKTAHRWNTIHAQLPAGSTHFFLVAHNVPTAREKTAIGIDNIRVAICDPKPDRINDYDNVYLVF